MAAKRVFVSAAFLKGGCMCSFDTGKGLGPGLVSLGPAGGV